MKYNVDIPSFWKKDKLAHLDNCFNENSPQVALGLRMNDECVFDELAEEGNPWGVTPRERRMDLNKRYNDKAEQIVGIRLLNEYVPKKEEQFPKIKKVGEVFGGSYEFKGTEWLTQSCNNENELEKRLDIIDNMDIREFILPKNWESEKNRIYNQFGKKPEIFGGVRGPVTLAMSIYGVENLIYLIVDEPDLAKRFSQTIFNVIKSYIDIFSEEAGYNKLTRPHGFFFCDDDCCMLNEEMYQLFGYPVLKQVFDYICPNKEDNRYQHSDSAMGHLLKTLSTLDLTGCNFGPTLTVEEIRKYMPKTRIDGQLAPFTLMNNDEDAIIKEIKRDCEMARRTGKGLNLTTAGSINNGSRLTSMRAIMFAIQEYGQY